MVSITGLVELFWFAALVLESHPITATSVKRSVKLRRVYIYLKRVYLT
ncbi:hypothetical protein VIBNISO65_1570006 [Vibrio nigripulchritudo SO65]|nr:hypothetical protein VIBNISO65_1570006 [Vibrio nigripulchritudo SO65]